MSNPRSPRVSAIPFGHLIGLGPKAAKGRAEDENKPDDTAASAEDGEDEDEPKDDAKKVKKTGKAKGDDEDRPDADDEDEDMDANNEDDGDDPEAEEDDEAEPEDDDKKVKKTGNAKKSGKAEEGDDGEARGVKAENARWAKVLEHKNAGDGRVAAACNMLKTTTMSASAIISTLATLPKASPAAGRGLYDRMANVPNADIGGDGRKSGAPTGNKAKDKASQFLAAAHAVNPDRIVAPRNAG